MARLIIILLFLFFSSAVDAKSPFQALKTFKKIELPSLQMWFPEAEISNAGYLRLYSTESFVSLNDIMQQNAMRNVILGWSTSLGTKLVSKASFIEVVEPGGGSLWRCRDIETDSAQLIDRWNLYRPLGDTTRGPVFFNFGMGMEVMEGMIGLIMNLRVGTFLLNNRLDTSFNFNLSYGIPVSAYGGGEGILNTSLGLMGRIHFPVAEKLTFNVGGMLGSGSLSMVGGLGIRSPHGIFDIMLNIGDGTTLSCGWNMFL